ncbi:uncharacterized protein RCC_03012 [Ramularia collo-cygni]|uniref:Methyltransferase type 11 domain-containing protein n=1 Tax=Ramularia collo-cygni TaxID=112498 RepID=A0A2D3UVT9_9PEZI|nr:uncharacterized protein RCC_03012 [Ramularia collo-cygni]CZT17180.1 uncharacterized protein RCC_03012 [Ramularia collo-cygni]
MSSDPIGASLEPESSKASSMEDYPRLLPSAMRKASDSSVETRQSTKLATSDSSGDESSRRVPSLATRRSITRLSSGENRSPVRVPPPINTNLHAKLPVIDSYDAEPTAWPQTDSSLPLTEDGREGLWLQPLDVKPSPKPARKWNFFSRAATTSPVKGKQQAVEDVEDAAMPPNRAIAHYAMSDNSHAIELDEVERIVQDDTDFEEDSMSDSESLPKEYPHGGRHLNRTPSPPNVEFGRDADFRVQYQAQRLRLNRQDSGETSKMLNAQSIFSGTQARPSGEAQLRPSVARAVHTPDMTGRRTLEPSQGYLSTPERANNSSRLPRLSPVGRIPPVVSRRDRDRKLPNTSFSRPFSSSQHRPFAKPPGSVYSQIREMASPTESNSQPVSSASTRSEGTMQDPISTAQTEIVSTDRDSVDLRGYGEFLAFPPRKGSDQSYSCSDSSSIPSWMTTLPPQKEDVWNEYNDFMDEVMPLRTPMRTPTTGSSLGAPFQYSSMLWDGNGNSWPIPTRTGLPPTQQLPPIPGVNTVPTILTVPQQISRFLRPSLSPITPDTISDLGNHISNFPPRFASLHNTQHPKRSSLTSARGSISSSRSSKTSTHSRSASLPSARNSQTDSSRMLQATSLAGIAEAPAVRNIKCSTDLRVGALMTSKWLSFGRVLFSPAHNEMQFADHPRILIVDGLSNDWSHFVALTYPDAQVYNIAQISGHSLSPIGATPPNLRQIRLPSFSASFPFPKDFFHTIVFRFPAATTEQTYAALLSECKRVLRPGGFLELAVLDLDLMNVGPKARRAVRGLKTRMQAKDSEVWLGNSSDLIVRGLGRRGFEGVKRFGVGVPVEGRIAAAVGQRERGGSSSSSGSSFAGISPSKELNLASLLDNTDFAMKSNDENITKMVARVGRWWYSSCYERILPVSDRSIWKDRTLLRECEEQGTSFRLFICQAQKPLLVRRRTKSV